MQDSTTAPNPAPLLWDVFCRVIDNFGDIGVCWRLCADLAGRGHTVRLWVDDASALAWMAPGALEGQWPGVTVRPWSAAAEAHTLSTLALADIWVEGFGCDIAPEFIAAYAYSTRASTTNDYKPPVWINLEYLSAEPYVLRCHGLPSPVLHGPAAGWTKHFFYPGFTPGTGGLLREPDLLAHQQAFAQPGAKVQWLASQGIAWKGEHLVSLFCYEPPALEAFLAQLDSAPTQLLVADGRASDAVRAVQARRVAQGLPGWTQLTIHYLPRLSQRDFDHLLWACDLNCVRGEDSLVRALWAGKPLVWHIYPQDDDAHVAKLDAFLDWLGADASLRAFHHAWNGTDTPLPLIDLKAWADTVQLAREKLLQMDDLTTQLLGFVLGFAAKKR
jgi:uncharacterized repeat protein (TIGR03837 family)